MKQSAERAGISPQETEAIVAGYEDAQLQCLKLALLFAALLVIPSFWSARNLPDRVLGEVEEEPAAAT